MFHRLRALKRFAISDPKLLARYSGRVPNPGHWTTLAEFILRTVSKLFSCGMEDRFDTARCILFTDA